MSFKIGDRVALLPDTICLSMSNRCYDISTITGETATRWKMSNGKAFMKRAGMNNELIGGGWKYFLLTEHHINHNAAVRTRREIQKILIGALDKATLPQLTAIHDAIVAALAETTTDKEPKP